MSTETKRKQAVWRSRIEEWRGSGLSQARYCREKGLSLATFGFWKRRLSERGEERFIRLPTQSPRVGRRKVRLILPDGLKVVFDERTPISSVSRVLEKLCGSTGTR